MRSRILVVDDDPALAEMLTIVLRGEGFDTAVVRDGAKAVEAFREHHPDLILLDLMLPGMSGADILRRLRSDARWARLPCIVLTAAGQEAQLRDVEALGASEVMTKPFSPRELVLRVGAILRRSTERARRPVVHTRRAAGNVVLDAALSLGRLGDRDLHLTPTEFKLLWLLAERPGRTVPLDVLANAMGHEGEGWGARAALRTAVYRLRGKLEEPGGGVEIESEHGRGYRLVIREPGR